MAYETKVRLFAWLAIVISLAFIGFITFQVATYDPVLSLESEYDALTVIHERLSPRPR